MDLASQIKSIVSQSQPIVANTAVAAQTIALEIEDPRSRGRGMRESLQLQLRLLVGAAVSDTEIERMIERIAVAFQVKRKLDATEAAPCSHSTNVAAGLALLASNYPWPSEEPTDVDRNDDVTFFTPATRTLLEAALGELQPRVIVEVGAWLGHSTRFLLNGSTGWVISIDTWLGSEEHQAGSEWMNRHPAHGDVLSNLYSTFLKNCWQHRDRLIPMRTTSISGFHQIHDAGVQPDLIFLDGAHDKLSVSAELELAHRLFPQARLLVDDYNIREAWLRGLVEAVDEFASKHRFEVQVTDRQACMLLQRGA